MVGHLQHYGVGYFAGKGAILTRHSVKKFYTLCLSLSLDKCLSASFTRKNLNDRLKRND